MRDINLNNIKDDDIREALTAIKESLMHDMPILRGDWVYFEIETPHGGNFTEVHNLGYAPKDFLITYDSAEITIDLDTTDDEVFGFSAITDGIVRGFLGRYEDKNVV